MIIQALTPNDMIFQAIRIGGVLHGRLGCDQWEKTPLGKFRPWTRPSLRVFIDLVNGVDIMEGLDSMEKLCVQDAYSILAQSYGVNIYRHPIPEEDPYY